MAIENIAEIITWKWNARPNVDFVVSNGVITRWAVAGVEKPTEAAVMAFEADFLAAGGAQARFRKEAADLLDRLRDTGSVALRATVIESLAYANATRAKLNALLAWLGTQTALTQRGQLAAMQLPEATATQAKTAIKARMTAGEAD